MTGRQNLGPRAETDKRASRPESPPAITKNRLSPAATRPCQYPLFGTRPVAIRSGDPAKDQKLFNMRFEQGGPNAKAVRFP